MWYELEKGSLKLIGFRTLTELILRGSMFSAMKYYTLSTFAVFNNTTPMVTLLLAFLILHEKLSCFNITTVILGFGAVGIITYGMT